MTELEKFKRRKSIFQCIVFVTAILILIALVLVLLLTSGFNTAVIVVLSVFIVYTVTILILFCVFDRYRWRLIEKYYGKVSEKDAEISRDLLKRIYCVQDAKYSFLSDEEYEFGRRGRDTELIKTTLREVSKGHKINNGLVDLYCEILQKTLSAPEKEFEANTQFNNFIFELVDLLERNRCDI